jgi:hypothetical protein
VTIFAANLLKMDDDDDFLSPAPRKPLTKPNLFQSTDDSVSPFRASSASFTSSSSSVLSSSSGGRIEIPDEKSNALFNGIGWKALLRALDISDLSLLLIPVFIFPFLFFGFFSFFVPCLFQILQSNVHLPSLLDVTLELS